MEFRFKEKAARLTATVVLAITLAVGTAACTSSNNGEEFDPNLDTEFID
ncbi:MAG: hypothetical protein QG623_690 [Patescibacteria group bacterium]|nr:hypothetical protein [Patescibacteria group bacterium]